MTDLALDDPPVRRSLDDLIGSTSGPYTPPKDDLDRLIRKQERDAQNRKEQSDVETGAPMLIQRMGNAMLSRFAHIGSGMAAIGSGITRAVSPGSSAAFKDMSQYLRRGAEGASEDLPPAQTGLGIGAEFAGQMLPDVAGMSLTGRALEAGTEALGAVGETAGGIAGAAARGGARVGKFLLPGMENAPRAPTLMGKVAQSAGNVGRRAVAGAASFAPISMATAAEGPQATLPGGVGEALSQLPEGQQVKLPVVGTMSTDVLRKMGERLSDLANNPVTRYPAQFASDVLAMGVGEPFMGAALHNKATMGATAGGLYGLATAPEGSSTTERTVRTLAFMGAGAGLATASGKFAPMLKDAIVRGIRPATEDAATTFATESELDARTALGKQAALAAERARMPAAGQPLREARDAFETVRAEAERRAGMTTEQRAAVEAMDAKAGRPPLDLSGGAPTARAAAALRPPVEGTADVGAGSAPREAMQDFWTRMANAGAEPAVPPTEPIVPPSGPSVPPRSPIVPPAADVGSLRGIGESDLSNLYAAAGMKPDEIQMMGGPTGRDVIGLDRGGAPAPRGAEGVTPQGDQLPPETIASRLRGALPDIGQAAALGTAGYMAGDTPEQKRAGAMAGIALTTGLPKGPAIEEALRAGVQKEALHLAPSELGGPLITRMERRIAAMPDVALSPKQWLQELQRMQGAGVSGREVEHTYRPLLEELAAGGKTKIAPRDLLSAQGGERLGQARIGTRLKSNVTSTAEGSAKPEFDDERYNDAVNDRAYELANDRAEEMWQEKVEEARRAEIDYHEERADEHRASMESDHLDAINAKLRAAKLPPIATNDVATQVNELGGNATLDYIDDFAGDLKLTKKQQAVVDEVNALLDNNDLHDHAQDLHYARHYDPNDQDEGDLLGMSPSEVDNEKQKLRDDLQDDYYDQAADDIDRTDYETSGGRAHATQFHTYQRPNDEAFYREHVLKLEGLGFDPGHFGKNTLGWTRTEDYYFTPAAGPAGGDTQLALLPGSDSPTKLRATLATDEPSGGESNRARLIFEVQSPLESGGAEEGFRGPKPKAQRLTERAKQDVVEKIKALEAQTDYRKQDQYQRDYYDRVAEFRESFESRPDLPPPLRQMLDAPNGIADEVERTMMGARTDTHLGREGTEYQRAASVIPEDVQAAWDKMALGSHQAMGDFLDKVKRKAASEQVAELRIVNEELGGEFGPDSIASSIRNHLGYGLDYAPAVRQALNDYGFGAADDAAKAEAAILARPEVREATVRVMAATRQAKAHWEKGNSSEDLRNKQIEDLKAQLSDQVNPDSRFPANPFQDPQDWMTALLSKELEHAVTDDIGYLGLDRAANVAPRHNLKMPAATLIYDKYVPMAMERIMKALGLPKPAWFEQEVGGEASNQTPRFFAITPEMRDRVKQAVQEWGGVGVLSLAGATLAPSDAGAEEPGKTSHAGVGAAIGAAALGGAAYLLSRGKGGASKDALEAGLKDLVSKVKVEPGAGVQKEGLDALIKGSTPITSEVRTMPGGPPGEPPVPPKAPTGEFPENREALMRRLGLTEETAPIVAQRITEIEGAIHRPVTHAEVRAQAQKLLNARGTDMVNIDPKVMDGAQGLALASLVSQNATAMESVAREVAAATTPEVRAEAEARFSTLHDATSEYLNVLMRGATEQGRALNANKILANLTMDPATWLLRAQRVAGEENPLGPEQVATITRMLQADDRKGVIQYVADLRKASVWEQFTALRRAGFLLAIPGRVAHLVGTGLNIAIEQGALGTPKAMLDGLLSHAAARMAGTEDVAQFRTRAAAFDLKGIVEGMGAGMDHAATQLGVSAVMEAPEGEKWAAWTKALRSAEVRKEALAQFDIPKVTRITLMPGQSAIATKTNAVLDTYTQIASKFAALPNDVLQPMAVNIALMNRAKVQAIREGAADVAGRTQELFHAPTEAMIEDATLDSDTWLFLNNGLMSRVASAVKTALATHGGEIARFPADWIATFTKVPANIASRTADYTGLGIARGAYNIWSALSQAAREGVTDAPEAMQKLRATQAKAVDAMTRGAIGGTGFMALGAYLASLGVMSGPAPTDPGEREAWRIQGKQPNSLLVAGRWWNIARLPPGGTAIAIGAGLYNAAQEHPSDRPSAGDVAASAVKNPGRMAALVGRSTLDQPMVQGTSAALEALKDPGGAGGQYGAREVASVIPLALRQAARGEGVQRAPEGVMENIEAGIPGLQSRVPLKRTGLGTDVPAPDSRLNAMVNPLGGTRDQAASDPIVAEMVRTGASVGAIKRGKKESRETYQWRADETHAWIREALDGLVNDADYQAADLKEQRKMFEDAVKRAHRAVGAYIRANAPEVAATMPPEP